MTVTIGHARIVSPGQSKPAPGEHVEQLLWVLNFANSGCDDSCVKRNAGNVLSSIASFLTADWCENPDRGENFQASLTILECLEKLQ